MTPDATATAGRRMTWRTVLGLVLVPLTVAGLLLWGLWNPDDRLGEMQAAVVNLDEPVTVNGQPVPLGRVLAGKLVGEAGAKNDDGTNFTWVLTDAKDAEQGVQDGRYATSVTIPKNFSAAATSLSKAPEDAERATIDIATSDRGRLLDGTLAQAVTQVATSTLNEQLGSQFVGNVFVGMNQLHDGVGDAAKGARGLASGGAQLADGASKLATGTEQLASGTQELATGAQQLADGQGALASGVQQYTAGASTLAENYTALAQGAQEAVGKLKTLVGELGKLQAAAPEAQAELTQGLTEAVVGTKTLQGTIPQLVAGCRAAATANPSYCDTLEATLTAQAGAIDSGLGKTQAGAGKLGKAMEGLQAAGGDSGSTGGDPVAKLDQLSAGLDQFGAGLNQFASQGGELASGAAQSASGAAQLSTGVGQLAAQTPELAKGATQLADGTRKSADGATQLANGLDSAVAKIPNYSKGERETVADTAVRQVEAKGDSALFSSAGAPLFAGIALWAGALAMFLVLAPLWRRARTAARSVPAIALRSAWPVALLGAGQGALAGILVPIALKLSLGEGVGFFALAILAGAAFALLVQGIVARFGGLGRFLAFAVLVVTLAAGVVSTAPGVLRAIGDGSPVGAALGGFQAVVSGGAGVGGAILALVLWALGGLALTAWAVARERRAHASAS
ncbi:YhgE/Pip family protein [Leucobacter iarius]|uniref:YhgE/Pip domain-containing protein n=1 Tax=Leucobacter iarius TaxID=333963 RepID=A0ABP4XHX1_9MICO